MSNFKRPPLEIPPISDEKIAELSLRIKPLVRSKDDDSLYFIKDVDARKIAFSWSPELTEKADSLKAIGAIATLHAWGYYGVFKPGIAEVLAQIPAGYLDEVVAFEVAGPKDAEDLNREKEALDAGFHVARTTLYAKAEL